MRALRLTAICGLLVLVWQAVVWLAETPHYILPGPARVGATWWEHAGLILGHAQTTLLEIALGLALGTLLGVVSALVLTYVRPARLWLLPVLVASQAVPVFALAPILVLWLGYGIASKVAMATLIIYFPVAANFYDGLRRTEPGWLDLARAMGASPWSRSGASACRRRCRRWPPACASPRRWRRSAPWWASGWAPARASASSCCTPTGACRST